MGSQGSGGGGGGPGCPDGVWGLCSVGNLDMSVFCPLLCMQVCPEKLFS